ncbi:MAG: hypothetical protein Q9222_004505 [Ikaeria aurantiellina]
MTSVPLHCNLCPKHPDFSDLSHLLTHIGSKGHLSHYHKAKLGSRQDPAIRQELDIYEQWYARYDIEKLLSQRMVLKESKRPNGTARATNRTRETSTKPAKIPKPRKKETAAAKDGQPPAEAAPKDLIDPRLSQPLSNTTPSLSFQQLSPATSSPGLDLASIGQAPIPRMRTFHTSASQFAIPTNEGYRSTPLSPSLAPAFGTVEADTESEDEHLRQDSIRSIYPEPPSTGDITMSIKHRHTELPSLQPTQAGQGRLFEGPAETGQKTVPQTPELKGIHYPGMSIFDSASPDAQRKRNQRKHNSILAQIEQESLGVECNEYIYWPDGKLKMCRFITGDVQSSPYKEDTPPPPPPKRRRGRKPKANNGDAVRKQSATIDSFQAPESQARLLRDESSIHDRLNMSPPPPTMLEAWSPVFSDAMASSHIPRDGKDWLLNLGEPTLMSQPRIPIYIDNNNDSVSRPGDPIKTYPNPLRPSPGEHSHYPVSAPYDITSATGKNTLSQHSQRRASPDDASFCLLDYKASTKRENNKGTPDTTFHVPTHDKENVPPLFEHPTQGSNTKPRDVHPSLSHRYFVTKGGQQPIISTTLPPEMAFAGMPVPPVYRTSLNPLNPNAHLRQSLPYTSDYTHYHPSPKRRLLDNEQPTGSTGQASHSKQEGSDRGAFMF